VSNEQCTQNFYIHYEKRKQLEINVKLIIQLNYQPKQVGILRTKSAKYPLSGPLSAGLSVRSRSADYLRSAKGRKKSGAPANCRHRLTYAQVRTFVYL